MNSPTAFEHYPVDALMRVTQRPEAVFVRGRGSWLWDSTGRRYLDLVQGWAVNTLGHASPTIVDAISRQAARLMHGGPGLYNDRAIELADRLAVLSGLDRVFFTNSGAEANEGAIKLARKFGQVQRGGAHRIVSFENGFHGRTLATMAASGKPGFDRIFPPAVPGFVKLPYNDLAAVEQAVTPDTVAVMLELVQGEAGVIEADPAFAQGLRALCDRHGLLLIVDEVQTGIGRCGTLFVHEQYGVTPDILTLGKGLGGGVPIGAMLAREAICCFEPGDQGGTYNGNALVCAAALAVVEAVTAPGFLDAVRQRGAALAGALRELSARHGLGAVRGRGLLLSMGLADGFDAHRVAEAARMAEGDGLLVNPVRPDRLRVMPALDCSAADAERACTLLDAALGAAYSPR